MENYNIEGHQDLARDPKTNAIVNVNSIDYSHYTAGRNAKRSRNERVDQIGGGASRGSAQSGGRSPRRRRV